MKMIRKLGLISVLLFLTAIAFCTPAFSQVITLITRNGKQFGCIRSGLQGFGTSCGTQYYEEIFVGTITEVKQSSEWDMSLTVRPEEIFKGNPPRHDECHNESRHLPP